MQECFPSDEPSSIFNNSQLIFRGPKPRTSDDVETKKSIYDELRRILSVQTTQEGNPMVLYLAKFMTSTSIVVQRESVGCLAELAQVRSTLIDSPSVGTKITLTGPEKYF